MNSARGLERIVERARKSVTPAAAESKKLSSVELKVSRALSRTFGHTKAIVPEIALGGSYAKGTWLRGAGDIDFYLLYPTSYPRSKLETEAIVFSKKAVEGYEIKMRFAEHPYVECFVDDIRVNIVPCYKATKGDWQSAADRSPFHAAYIRGHFDDRLRSETRILKKFVKSAALYGAEVKTEGFSGYVCEVLTLKFGSFAEVLQNISRAKQGEVISLEDYDRDVAAAFKSPLVILDPIDTTRNLGMAISRRNVAKLMLRARSFLANPSGTYFVERSGALNWNVRRNKELLRRTIVISFKTRERSVDILWGQLGKSLKAIVQLLDFYGFEVLRSRASSNETSESAFVLLLRDNEIPRFKPRAGPDVFRKDDVESFLAKNSKRALLSWIGEDGKPNFLFEQDDSIIDAKRALQSALSDRQKLNSIGLAKEIRREMQEKFVIQDGLTALRSRTSHWLTGDINAMVARELI